MPHCFEHLHNACPFHCCIRHGCKYGYDCCPVVLAEIDQEYPCEACGENAEEEAHFWTTPHGLELTALRAAGRISAPRPILSAALVAKVAEGTWRAVLTTLAEGGDELHEGCEVDTPADCSLYEPIEAAIRAALEAS